MSTNEFLMRNMSADRIERFYNSAESDVERTEKYLARHGLQLPKDGVCVDYGCGLGRTTLSLARRCGRVLAIDVSEPHLEIARNALAARGVTNVEFRLLREPRDLVMDGIDFFHSVIVLQHNPPPIIAEILRHAFSGLNPGGSAFFQVTTYGFNYSWNFDQYIANTLPLGETEMHAIPQSVVFALAAAAGCLPAEVQRDGCVPAPAWISNTFLIGKPTAGNLDPTGRRAERAGLGGRLRRLIAPSIPQHR